MGGSHFRHSRKDIPDLEQKLRSQELAEDEVSDTVRALLAAAFHGKPIPERRPFQSLTATQQRVLKTIAELDSYYFCVSGLLSTPLFSYGLPVFESYQLKNYIEGRDFYAWPQDAASS